MQQPHLTPERLAQSQRDHERCPRQMQLIYQAETKTLAWIQRNERGEVVFMSLEGPLDEGAAAKRVQQVFATAAEGSVVVQTETFN